MYCKKNTYSRVSFLIKLQTPSATLFENGALAQVFSWKFCETFENTIFIE